MFDSRRKVKRKHLKLFCRSLYCNTSSSPRNVKYTLTFNLSHSLSLFLLSLVSLFNLSAFSVKRQMTPGQAGTYLWPSACIRRRMHLEPSGQAWCIIHDDIVSLCHQRPVALSLSHISYLSHRLFVRPHPTLHPFSHCFPFQCSSLPPPPYSTIVHPSCHCQVFGCAMEP